MILMNSSHVCFSSWEEKWGLQILGEAGAQGVGAVDRCRLCPAECQDHALRRRGGLPVLTIQYVVPRALAAMGGEGFLSVNK